MERRTIGPRGLPHADAIRHARRARDPLPLAARRVGSLASPCDVARARRPRRDGRAVARVAPARQLAPVLDAAAARRVHRRLRRACRSTTISSRGVPTVASPGSSRSGISSFIKQLRVLGYSRRLAAVRTALNAIAPFAGTPRLPAAGAVLPSLAALHLCVPNTTSPRCFARCCCTRTPPTVGAGHLFLTLALDRRDPLRIGAARSARAADRRRRVRHDARRPMAWASARWSAAALRVGTRMSRRHGTGLGASLATRSRAPPALDRRARGSSSRCCCSRTRARQPRGSRLPHACGAASPTRWRDSSPIASTRPSRDRPCSSSPALPSSDDAGGPRRASDRSPPPSAACPASRAHSRISTRPIRPSSVAHGEQFVVVGLDGRRGSGDSTVARLRAAVAATAMTPLRAAYPGAAAHAHGRGRAQPRSAHSRARTTSRPPSDARCRSRSCCSSLAFGAVAGRDDPARHRRARHRTRARRRGARRRAPGRSRSPCRTSSRCSASGSAWTTRCCS